MVELFKAISNHDIFLSWGIGICLLAAFFWTYDKYRHKRYRNRILLLAFILGVTLSLYLSNVLPVPAVVAIIVLWAVQALVSYLTTVKSKAIFPETRSIACLKTLVRRGEYTKLEKRFPKRPFWIMSTSGQKEWGLLWAKKLMMRDQMRQAYEIHSYLLKLPLFEQEEDEIRLYQVANLLMLGDTIGAKSVFEQVPTDQKKKREILIQQSFFNERTGDFEKARENLLLATREYEAEKDTILARIYNNLARMEKSLGNTTDALHYYCKSAELARHLEEKYLIHIAYPNLIDTYLLMGDRPNATQFMIAYSELIDKENVDDLLRFHNYRIEYARQIKDHALFLESLVKGRIELLPKISEKERLLFEISELRIRRNSECGWEEKLFSLAHHFPEYLKLEFPDRYHALKEMYNILLELARRNNLGPFAGLFSLLVEFMGCSKEDINRYLLVLPDYCVDERCYWEKQKAYLHKVQQNNEPQKQLTDLFDGIFEHLRNIKDIQLQHGNPLPAIEADLDIADESMAIIQQVQEPSVMPYFRQIMERHVNDACTDLAKYCSHPVSSNYVLRLARYTLFLGHELEAKKYFEDFLQSKISAFHYAAWIQRYYNDLAEFFNRPVE